MRPASPQFPCPLCRGDGREVLITAEFEHSTRVAIVAGLSGCAHADAFGQIGPLSLEQECRLIETAIDAFATSRGRRVSPS
jgi:hypothetical protein